MTPAEIDRAEAHRKAVMAWAHRLPAVLASPDAARRLALDVVDGLLWTFARRNIGKTFVDSMVRVRDVHEKTFKPGADFETIRAEADRLGSLLLPRAAPAWTWETRAPYEVCEALRRACEAEALLCVGILVPCPPCKASGRAACTICDDGHACVMCDGKGKRPDPLVPPLLALLLHDAHALLSDLRADTAGLEQLVADAEAREREKPTARPVRQTNEARRWPRESETGTT